IAIGLPGEGHVDQHHVTMRFEPGVGSQLAGADRKLQSHRRATAIACHPPLAYVGRALGEESYERECGSSRGTYAAGRAMPGEIKYVRVSPVGVRVRQCKPSVPPAPCFDVREQMQLGLLSHPGWLAERRDQLVGAGHELPGISDPVPAVVTVPARCHDRKLN